ncbi:MAG: hypothetical protein J1D88_05295 [Treponema sp.]|nr:hypothetical protein [Treponema sp.]
MLELSVNTRSPAAITAALKKIREMVMTGAVPKTTSIHIILEPGIYREIVRYNLSNPLIIESSPGTKPQDCVVQAENCEAFHAGPENRAVFVVGPNATDVSLKNFSVINTHVKTGSADFSAPDAAEAFFWNNTTGTLSAKHMRFEGRQNTLYVKGFCWFLNCFFSGDTDFIYGDCDTALFEDCEIFTRGDNRGERNGYVVKSLALANKAGFVFSSCRFTAENRKKNSIYIFRTEGKGGATTAKCWDSAALINCMVSDDYDPELEWDDDHELEVYPRANAKIGWREYNTRVVLKNGSIEDSDTSRRNIKSYVMTEDEYFNLYSSRYLILRDTPFAKKFD